MAVVIKEGNVFDSDAKIICHQVNCQGVMGSGVAKEPNVNGPAESVAGLVSTSVACSY